MKKVLITFLVSIILTAPVFGAIIYKDERYSWSHAESTTDKIGDVVDNIKIDISSTSTKQTAKEALEKTDELFIDNGINLKGIFKEMGTGVVTAVTWMIELVKFGLDKL